ncbi:MAG: T9SS type A sorting domain-containing protein [Candidatus Aegiribacteria sp.]|nr:T9SS type A sorting domain-containing protein [Candidatus Aegiribacteria sp.]
MKFLLSAVLIFASAFAAGPVSVGSWQSFGGGEGSVPQVTVLESDIYHMLVEVSIPGFRLYDSPAGGRIWDLAELPGCYSQGDEGLPDLPSVPRLFALPWGMEAVVTVEDVSFTVYENMEILPRQTPEIDMYHPPFPFVMNEEFYEGTGSFPHDWAYIDNEGGWSGLNAARLVVNPLRFNPNTGTLKVASSITLRVDFNGSPGALALPVNPSMIPAMEQNIINWDTFRYAAVPLEGSRDAGVEYIFVCTEDNVDWVSELFETHHYLGLHARVETLTAPATPAQILNAISSNYISGVTRFACIVGTHDELPSYNYGSYVGDYYYAMMNAGNYPDLSVGRLTGDSAQIVHQVEKILSGYMDYDFGNSKTPGIIPSETILAAHQENYPNKYTLCCNQVAAYNYSLCDITFTKVYPPEGGTAAMVSDSINNGTGTVCYRGHGSTYTWQWSPGWYAGRINALTNTFMPPVFNIACLNGKHNTSGRCLSEAWQWAAHGASGNLGATNTSYTIANNYYVKKIYMALYSTGTFRVCEAIMEATTYIISTQGAPGLTNAKMYIWFGDPAMDIWTFDSAGHPGELNISHPANILPGNQDVTITVTDGGSPVSGVNVTLTDGVDNYGDGMTFYEEGTTNASGEVTINITAPSTGTVFIGAQLHNYRYDISWVVIGTGIEGSPGAGPALSLETPLPNPVATGASLAFTVPSGGNVRLNVYDVSGRIVETVFNGHLEKGSHSVEWSPESGIASGLYFVRLDTEEGSVTTQAMVIR